MKPFFYIGSAVFTFALGVIVSVYSQIQFEPMSEFDCSWPDQIAGNTGYDLRDTKTLLGSEVRFYRENSSPETTRYLFQSNSESNGLIEKGFKVNAKGQKIGERGIIVFPNGKARIYWTEADAFWVIEAESLKLARKVEKQCLTR